MLLISQIKYLDNAIKGKNNWWRYLLTILLLLIGGKLLADILPVVICIIFNLLFYGFINYNNVNETLTNPFFVLVIIGFTYALLLSTFYICIRIVHKKSFISLINTVSRVDWPRMLKGGILWFFILGSGTLISIILNPNNFKITFNPNSFVLLVILSLIVFMIQAPYEELFFRGYLIQGLSLLTKKPVLPLIITSVLFAVLHYGNSTNIMMNLDLVIYALIFGITMGIIVLGENRLETAMGIHIADNFFATTVVNNSDLGLGNLPSIMTVQKIPDPIIHILMYLIYASIILVVLFWNKKEPFFKIFKT